MDKTVTWSGKHSDNQKRLRDFWMSQTPKERLKASYYLNSVAYNFDIDSPPRMDKSYAYTRKHDI